MPETDHQFDRCSHCGALQSAHIVLPMIPVPVRVLLCPRSTYRSPHEAEAPTADDAALQRLLEEA